MREIVQADDDGFTEERSMFYLNLDATTDAIPILNKYADFISSFEVKMSSLDDVFLTITGKDDDNNVGIY